MQGVQVQSLVRELRSHMPWSQKTKQTKKQKQYCNMFSKDFDNGPYQKKERKKENDLSYQKALPEHRGPLTGPLWPLERWYLLDSQSIDFPRMHHCRPACPPGGWLCWARE